jgi:putative flavoprotein involved in K+ transport
MAQSVDTAVVGGGQSGLAMSYHLTQDRRDHVVLERSRVAESWRSRVWDSFCLVTPNWTVQLPGLPYDGPDPDGFMPRAQLIEFLDRYVEWIRPPLRTGVEVTAVRRKAAGDRYILDTTDGSLEARNVVVAAGQYQRPKIPGLASELPEHVLQIHSSEYRNPRELPPGAVLVVGTGQSGAQIAEEIYQSGRRVFLVVSRCGRGPRRYRGKDTSRWMFEMGMFDQTVDKLPPDAKSRCNMHVSGRYGGHDLNLRAFARDGVVLLGRLEGAANGRIFLATDLRENLANADQSAAKLKKSIDEFIRKMAIDAPEDDAANDFGPNEGAEGEPLLELDLATKDIASVVWATGYRREFGWIHLPITGEDGDPIHRRGVSPFPGLFFLGLRLLHKPKSELLLGVGEDAMFLTSQIRSRDRRRTTDGEP